MLLVLVRLGHHSWPATGATSLTVLDMADVLPVPGHGRWVPLMALFVAWDGLADRCAASRASNASLQLKGTTCWH
jgi:hypothetical protein